MLETLTKDTFEPMRGEPFVLVASDTVRVDLTLADVRGHGLQGQGRREQFSLHFRGPLTPSFPQRIYRVEHARMGAMEIFLVPIARDAQGMTYEAVFT